MIASDHHGVTIAADYESTMRSRTDNMTDRPVSTMLIPLPFKGRSILKKSVILVFIEGFDIAGLQTPCSDCAFDDRATPRVEPVPFYYIRVQEDRDERQHQEVEEVSSATFSPKFLFKNRNKEQQSTRQEASAGPEGGGVDSRMQDQEEEELLEEQRMRSAAASEERLRKAEARSREQHKRIKEYAKKVKAKEEVFIREKENLYMQQEWMAREHERKMEQLNEREARMEALHERVEEKFCVTSLNKNGKAGAVSSDDDDEKVFLPAGNTNSTRSNLPLAASASGGIAAVGRTATALWRQNLGIGNFDPLRPQQELVNISNTSHAKRKERENRGGENGTNRDDIIESPAKIACLDLK